MVFIMLLRLEPLPCVCCSKHRSVGGGRHRRDPTRGQSYVSLHKKRQWTGIRYLLVRFRARRNASRLEDLIFTKVIDRLIDAEAYRGLQIALMLRPEQGPVIRGGGGLRKLRWARPGGGKSGGLRVIYFWAPAEEAFYMLYACAKNEQGDLTRAQTRALGQLVREEFK
jgi:hypothetical protein